MTSYLYTMTQQNHGKVKVNDFVFVYNDTLRADAERKVCLMSELLAVPSTLSTMHLDTGSHYYTHCKSGSQTNKYSFHENIKIKTRQYSPVLHTVNIKLYKKYLKPLFI
jgi:hypothetical protein